MDKNNQNSFKRKNGTNVFLDDGNAWTNRTDGHGKQLPVMEILKMVLMCVTLIAPLRIFIACVTTLATTLYMLLVLCGHRSLDENGRAIPLSRCRRFMLWPVSWGCRIVMWCFGYWWIEEEYPEGVRPPCGGLLRQRDAARVVVANHTTFIDAFAVGFQFIPVVVTNFRTTLYPLIGPAIAALGPILIPRSPDEKKMLPAPSKELERRPREDDPDDFSPILIFPEGTTTNQDYLLQFQRGAFLSGMPVQPICISYPFQNLDATWSVDAGTLWLAFRMTCQVYNRVKIKFLPVVHPTPEMAEDPEQYGRVVRAQMADALEVNTLEFSDHDTGLINGLIRTQGMPVARYAIRHLLRAHTEVEAPATPAKSSSSSSPLQRMPSDGIVSTRQAEAVTRLNAHFVTAIAAAFANADQDRDGVLKRSEFCDAVGGPISRASAGAIFDVLESDGSAGVVRYADVISFFGRLVLADVDAAVYEVSGDDRGAAGTTSTENKMHQDTEKKSVSIAAPPPAQMDRENEDVVPIEGRLHTLDEEQEAAAAGVLMAAARAHSSETPKHHTDPTPPEPEIERSAVSEKAGDVEAPLPDLRVQVAFLIFDQNTDGQIDAEDVVQVMQAVARAKTRLQARSTRRNRRPANSSPPFDATEAKERVQAHLLAAGFEKHSSLTLQDFGTVLRAGDAYRDFVHTAIEGIHLTCGIDPDAAKSKQSASKAPLAKAAPSPDSSAVAPTTEAVNPPGQSGAKDYAVIKNDE